MIDFAKVRSFTVPEGEVEQIAFDGEVLWKDTRYRYVSLGDSIAAGHTINEDWESDYGIGSQYGENDNKSTVIVPNSYTDLIRTHLESTHGKGGVKATSFAHSGDTVAALMDKLTHQTVRRAIAKANLVTICIGANDILGAVSGDRIAEYVNTGSLTAIENEVEVNLTNLNTDSHPTSYRSLFDKLTEINPNAKFVFTTVYNPYKYLWLEEGRDGFLAPLLATIPNLDIFGVDIDGIIKDRLLGISIVQQMFSRFNALSRWVETRVTRLDTVLKNKINAYQSVNPNFVVADTKAVFDPVPDRPISAPKHYNDLVNVEFTKGFNTMTMDWGKLWDNNIIKDQEGNEISNTVCNDAGTFWGTLVGCYLDGINIDMTGLADTLVNEILEHVIMPDMDPHPEEYGQYALKCSFADALGWTTIPRRTITYNAGTYGAGSMATQTVVALDNYTAYTNIASNAFTPNTTGYYYTNWSGSNGGTYSGGDFVGLTSDLTLTAQWSNLYTVTFRHSNASARPDSSNTGPMECYALWIEGVEQSDLGVFTNSARTYQLPYGTSIGVIAQTAKGNARSYITMNGKQVNPESGTSKDARYGFTLKADTDICFEWNYWLENLIYEQSYWNCYITD